MKYYAIVFTALCHFAYSYKSFVHSSSDIIHDLGRDGYISNLSKNKINENHRRLMNGYPYAVRIDDLDCSGALIAPDIVLTSASCTATKNGNLILGSDDDTEVSKIIHIEADEELVMGILKIERNENDLKKFEVVHINGNINIPMKSNNTPLTSISWNNAAIGKVVYGDLKYERESCPDNMICATGETKEDYVNSGSPLVFKSDGTGFDVLVGISNTKGSLRDYSPVSYNVKWIKEQVCRLSDYIPDYLPCSSDYTLTYIVRLDNYPEEHSWKLFKNVKGEERLIDTSSSYSGKKNQVVVEEITVQPGTYTFRIYDAYGDGLQTHGPNVELFMGSDKLAHLRGNWGKTGVFNFEIN